MATDSKLLGEVERHVCIRETEISRVHPCLSVALSGMFTCGSSPRMPTASRQTTSLAASAMPPCGYAAARSCLDYSNGPGQGKAVLRDSSAPFAEVLHARLIRP